MDYIPRLADAQLDSDLGRIGGVLIEGPRACGKTETALRASASHVRLDANPDALRLFEIDPNLLLEGDTPRLIDEWQIQPDIWNYVRHAIDRRSDPGQFILTGSTAAVADSTRHSGAGRFARLRMRTLTLTETGHSDASVSLSRLLAGESVTSASSALEFKDLLDRLSRGGWPAMQRLSNADARRSLVDYIDTIAEVDIRTPDGVSRDPQRVRSLIRSLARSTSSEIRFTAIAKDLRDTSRDTVRDYWDALARIFAAEEQPAWSTHLRSSATLRKEPKRHLADPGLAAAALNADPDALLKDLNFTGQLFESQVVHDLKVYAAQHHTDVYHARDSYGREADVVIQLPDGRWHGFEVKLGSRPEVVDAAAASLRKFADDVDTKHALSGLTVITTGQYSYPHPEFEGVNLVSISHLGP